MVNSHDVVHETIDDEVILIHLGTGTYYSLAGVAADLWSLIADGAVEQASMLSEVQRRYEGDSKLIATAVSAFLDELHSEELIELGEPAEGAARPSTTAGIREPASGAIPFVAPVLNKYTDMQDFLLADPLHDVDEQAGWPHVRAD